MSVEDLWTNLKTNINQDIEHFIPLKTCRKTNCPPWMTKHVKRLGNRKCCHYQAYINTRSLEDENHIEQSEREYKKALRQTKYRYESSIANTGDKRQFNRYIKQGFLKLHNSQNQRIFKMWKRIKGPILLLDSI